MIPMTELLGILSGSLAVGLLVWTAVPFVLQCVPFRSSSLRRQWSFSGKRSLERMENKVRSLFKASKIQRRLGLLQDLFPQALGMTIQVLRTGQTVPQALDYLSRECPEPLRGEFSMVCAELHLGASTEEALARMLERYPGFSDLRRFLEAFKISRKTGANLTHLLQTILEGIEEKGRILRKVEAMTAQARLSGLLMGLLPIFLGTIFFVLDPSLMMPLFTERAGWALLVLAMFLESIGYLWIRQLLRVEV